MPALAQGLVGAAFLYAALMKASDMDAVLGWLTQIPIARFHPRGFARALVLCELVVGASLLATSAGVATVVAVGVLMSFTVALIVLRVVGYSKDCRCFGREPASIRTSVARNLVLIALLVLALSGSGGGVAALDLRLAGAGAFWVLVALGGVRTVARWA